MAEASDFTTAIGVAAGRVLAGNVGAHQRYEFTVIGDAVNEAACLCELAETDPNRLLTSASTIAAADPSEAILRGRVTQTRLGRPQ